MSMNEELGELMEALRDGTIEDAQVARLDQILAEDPGAADYFVDRAWLRAELEVKLGGARAVTLPAARRSGRGLWWAAAAAALIALVFAATRSSPLPPSGASYEGLAVLTRALDARWEGSGPAVGSVLPQGHLAIESGAIQIEFFSGARVILEGPAEFELVSTSEAKCSRGKLRAFVPPQAHGFIIRTPAMMVQDWGTEFGLRVDPAGGGEVHVFQGSVFVQTDATSWHLEGGKGLRVDRAGAMEPREADPEAFVSVSDLNLRSAEVARSRFARWGGASERLRKDPRVVVYYSFEDAPEWSRELRSQRAERSPLDGAIIGA